MLQISYTKCHEAIIIVRFRHLSPSDLFLKTLRGIKWQQRAKKVGAQRSQN